MDTKKRDSNIELFRIVVMLLIISHHFVVNSGLLSADGPVYADGMTARALFIFIFGMWGKIGINCFVMITGYFMCKSDISARKFVKLLAEVMFYRIIIQCVFWVAGYSAFSLKGLIKTLMPINSVETNFTGCFLLFYLCIPFLNKLIHSLNEKQHIRLLALCFLIYVFFGTVKLPLSMNYVSWFCVIYFIASYIRLYPKKIYDRLSVWIGVLFALLVVDIVSVPACLYVFNMPYMFVTDSNTILAVLTGIAAFMVFKNIRIGYNRFINAVASTTFGIFIIHTNGDAMRKWLWNDVLHVTEHYASGYIWLYAVGSVVAIFIICSLIDFVRIHTVEKAFLKLWDKIGGNIKHVSI